MKSTFSILSILVAAATWISPVFAYIFCYQDKNLLVPLSYKTFPQFSFFSTDPTMDSPVEFRQYQDLIYTDFTETPGYVGFYGVDLAFGKKVPETHFTIDVNGRITGQTFYTCDDPSNPGGSILSYKLYGSKCKELQLYFVKQDMVNKPAPSAA